MLWALLVVLFTVGGNVSHAAVVRPPNAISNFNTLLQRIEQTKTDLTVYRDDINIDDAERDRLLELAEKFRAAAVKTVTAFEHLDGGTQKNMLNKAKAWMMMIQRGVLRELTKSRRTVNPAN